MSEDLSIKVLSGGAAYGLLHDLSSQFKLATGYTIDGTFNAVGAIADRVREGTEADLLILTSEVITELTSQGYVEEGSAVNIGSVQTSIALRIGDVAPQLETSNDLRAALLNSDEIYIPDNKNATAGIHFIRIAENLGIRETIDSCLRPFPNGSTAMQMLAKSTAKQPIGCTQETEIINTPGVYAVGPLPRGCQLATTYTAAVGSRARAPSLVHHLIVLLTSDSSRLARQRAGFQEIR